MLYVYCILLYHIVFAYHISLCNAMFCCSIYDIYIYIHTYDYICLFMDQARKLSGNKAYVAADNNSKGSLSSLKHTQNDVLR